MFSKLFFAAIAAQALFVRADPNPTTPGPGDIFNQGTDCKIAWDLDTTGTWTQMTIDLMTGDNWNMIPLASIGTFDATKVGTYSYPCPTVNPNSAIYFYQFKEPTSNTTYWTTRFAIADANGATTPPTENVQPSGDKIPWGTGKVVGDGGDSSLSLFPSNSVPPPSSIPSSIPSSSPSSSGVSSPASSTLSTPSLTPSGSHSSSSGAKPSASGNSSSSTSNDSGAIAISSHGAAGIFVALAAVFTLMF